MSKEKQVKTADVYYSVPEFAELAGVSKQAVYERIRRDLSGYTRKDGGKIVISGEAFAFVGVKTDSKDSQDDGKDKNQAESRDIKDDSINNQEKMGELLDSLYIMKENKTESKADQAESKARSQGESSAFLDYLIQENIRLLAEIEKKDRIIAEKDDVITGYADQFAEFARREQEISAKALNTTGQAQLLHAMSSEQIEAEAETIEETPEAPSKWVPWWKRKK